MTREEIALNIACDLLIGSNLYGYDYDRIFEEIMNKEGCVSVNLIKEYILEHIEELGKEYFVKVSTKDENYYADLERQYNSEEGLDEDKVRELMIHYKEKEGETE